MTAERSDAPATPEAPGTLHLARWTATSGSNVRSRGAVVNASGDHEWRASADGNGPVNALDTALRKALRAFYPGLDEVNLVDYKVRILDGDAATAARTRVVIDSMDGTRTWSTMGSDTNIIAASAAALADSLEYAIWKTGASQASVMRRAIVFRIELKGTTSASPCASDTNAVSNWAGGK